MELFEQEYSITETVAKNRIWPLSFAFLGVDFYFTRLPGRRRNSLPLVALPWAIFLRPVQGGVAALEIYHMRCMAMAIRMVHRICGFRRGHMADRGTVAHWLRKMSQSRLVVGGVGRLAACEEWVRLA